MSGKPPPLGIRGAIPLGDDFVERVARTVFGGTPPEAQAQGVCLACKQPPTFTTPEGRSEYEISGLCESCWERITKEPDEPGEPG